MKPPANLTALLASLAAALLALSISLAAHAIESGVATAQKAEAGKHKGATEAGELKFKGLSFEADRFIVDEFYEMVRMQRLKGNISGGVTPDGLNLRFDW